MGITGTTLRASVALNVVRVIAPVSQQDAGFGQVVVHDQIKAQIV